MLRTNSAVRVLALLAAFCVADFAYAHAVVTESTFKIETIKPRAATQVKLTFNSSVELALSKFYLVSKGDVHQELSASKTERQGQVSVAMPALEPGDYALRFRVFAADGHLTEEIIPFSVKP